MQYGDAPYFVQRMKFYALHKFNAMVKRGKFDYGTLTKIYCVAILANDILPYPQFHTVANLRNEQGELFDEQMTFITIELDKFTLQEVDCQTDLQKLIYTMKTIHTHTFTNPIQFPKFWDEDWLKVAIDEAESRKIKEAREAEKIDTIKNALAMGLTVEQCASLVSVSVDFVKSIQRQLSAN